MPFHRLKKTLRVLMVMFCILGCGTALADIYKCIDADGTLTYSDEGCPEGTRQLEHVAETPPADGKQLRPQVPLKDRLKRLLHAQDYGRSISLEAVLGIYGVMSAVCFIAYYRDKRKARRRQWRTPESTLHLIELLGGWPGGLLAQWVLRHKVKKVRYQIRFWSIVLLHGLVWADVLLGHRMSRAVWEPIHRMF
jgi:uncharacterized membrane protein YsdA (DUF1294 family)